MNDRQSNTAKAIEYLFYEVIEDIAKASCSTRVWIDVVDGVSEPVAGPTLHAREIWEHLWDLTLS
jgi:hypothetical protein